MIPGADVAVSSVTKLGKNMASGLSKNATYLINKGINYVRMRKLLNPFDIYEFSVVLYWYICFTPFNI